MKLSMLGEYGKDKHYKLRRRKSEKTQKKGFKRQFKIWDKMRRL